MKMTPRVIVIGGLAVVLSVIAVVVFLPYIIFNPEDSLNARPYTKLEAEGRALYVSNGCTYCHSQFTRPNDVTPDRPSEAGDFNYDRPHQLGTLRTGPDLANIGNKRSSTWEIEHLIDPRKYTPNSIMPSYSFLSRHQLEALAAYLGSLGDQQSAQADPKVGEEWENWKNPLPVTASNWYEGKKIFITRCQTCHGCAGNGMGEYSHKLNQRPADLRQSRYKNYPEGFYMWRISDGVPGTAMPQWKNSLSTKERQLVALYVENSFVRPKPHNNDEGEVPREYMVKDPLGITPNDEKVSTFELVDRGKKIYTVSCSPCHGYSGAGRGPDAVTAPKLVPEPPDLRDREHFSTFTDGDWFWRISEGVIFRSMPQWKYLLTEQERWEVTNYLRDILVLPEKGRQPDETMEPEKYAKLKMPKNTSYTRGRQIYMIRCAPCHGYGGQGEGIEGTHLEPAPANFISENDEGMASESMGSMDMNQAGNQGSNSMDMQNNMSGMDSQSAGGSQDMSSMAHAMSQMSDGHWFWLVSAGVRNTAMPIWSMLLSEQERWDVVKYVRETFSNPKPPLKISYTVPESFRELVNPVVDGGDETVLTASVANGAKLYKMHCSNCHGDNGAGGGHYAAELATKPGLLANNSNITKGGDDFIYYMISDGIDHTAMSPFGLVFSDSEIWDLVNYVKTMSGKSHANMSNM